MTENETKIINGKEIVLYRETETELYRFSKDAVDVLLQAIEEVEQYRAIGTVEEFKVLKDKGIPIIHGKAELELHDKQVRVDAISELKQRFRSEYEEMMELEMEDCINWADWLDATAEQIIADRKG